MKRDAIKIYAVAAAYFAVLVATLFIKDKLISNLAVAFATAACAAVALVFIKKRSAPDIHKNEATLVCFAAAAVGLTLLYLSGLKFGFVKIVLNETIIIFYLLPAVAVLICGEVLRRILLSQNRRGVTIITYFLFILSDIAFFTDKNAFRSGALFMSAFGFVVLPSISANLLYCVLSKSYGAKCALAYRAIISLYQYVLPVRAAVPNALLAFLKIVFPLLVLLFLRALYGKRSTLISRRKAAWQTAISIVSSLCMIVCVSFVAGIFDTKMMVVGSESMSGSLEKGDVIIYDKYEGEVIPVGQIILFDRNGATIIHRVIDVKKINGVYRYYTKGDANEGSDSGYITSDVLVGVVKLRVPFAGYPTIWLHGLF